MRKAIYFLISLFVISSCSRPSYLTSPKDFKDQVHGMRFEYGPSDNKISGEIIAVTVDEITLLINDVNSFLIRVPSNQIESAEIIVSGTSDSPEKFGPMAGLMCLSSAGHGYYGLFTLPINMIVGIGVSQDALQGSYRIKYPSDVHWLQMTKFARFPQGIPPNFKAERIR